MTLIPENEGLYIPTGWNHSVFTLVGPGLIGQNFILISDLEISIKCICSEMDYLYHINHVLESFKNFVDAFESVLQNMPFEKTGSNMVEGGETQTHEKLVDGTSSKQDQSQEHSKKAEPYAVEQIVDKQFRKSRNELVIAGSQDYQANNQAILDTGLKRDLEQDTHYETIWKILEAVTQLAKRAYSQAFGPKCRSLNTVVQTYFSCGKPYPWSRWPGCTDLVLKRSNRRLHYLNYHSIHFLAKSRSQ